MDASTGAVLLDIRAMQRVWVRLGAQASRSHGPTLRIQLLAPSHPDAVRAAAGGGGRAGSADRPAETSAWDQQLLTKPPWVRSVSRNAALRHCLLIDGIARLRLVSTMNTYCKYLGFLLTVVVNLSLVAMAQVAPRAPARAYLPPGVANPVSSHGNGLAGEDAPRQDLSPAGETLAIPSVCSRLIMLNAILAVPSHIANACSVTMQERNLPRRARICTSSPLQRPCPAAALR